MSIVNVRKKVQYRRIFIHRNCSRNGSHLLCTRSSSDDLTVLWSSNFRRPDRSTTVPFDFLNVSLITVSDEQCPMLRTSETTVRQVHTLRPTHDPCLGNAMSIHHKDTAETWMANENVALLIEIHAIRPSIAEGAKKKKTPTLEVVPSAWSGHRQTSLARVMAT